MSKLGSLDKVLLDQVLEDVARMMSEKDVLDYVWIGSVGTREYRMCVTAYEQKQNGQAKGTGTDEQV